MTEILKLRGADYGGKISRTTPGYRRRISLSEGTQTRCTELRNWGSLAVSSQGSCMSAGRGRAGADTRLLFAPLRQQLAKRSKQLDVSCRVMAYREVIAVEGERCCTKLPVWA